MKRKGGLKEIKVGVIGYGGAFNMGRHHFNEMRQAGMTPWAVAEIDKERLKSACDDFPGIETYASAEEMLEKSAVDLVTIITPHNTHAALALQCIEAGRHVVCEKPLAIATAECDLMIEAARKKRVLLSTYHNRHWDGCVLQALKTVRSGRIGDVFRVEAHMGGWGAPRNWWRSSKSVSGGVLYDWGVHLLEYTFQIVASDLVEVAGYAKRGFWASKTCFKADTNEDEAFAVVRYANGAWSTLSISSVESKPKQGMLEITGTKGTYIMDMRGWEVHTHGTKGETITVRGANPPDEGWRLYRNIADHLFKGRELIVTPQWARRPIHVLDLADQSARKGVAIRTRYK